MNLRFALVLAACALAAASGAFAQEEAVPLTASLLRRGPDPGDEASATLAADGTITLRAVRGFGPVTETFKKTARLHSKAAQAMRRDLEQFHAFTLPPLAAGLQPNETPAIVLDVTCGERSLHREYPLLQLSKDLPDHAVIQVVELYTGLGYWFADHLFAQAAGRMENGMFPEALAYCRAGLQALGRPWIEEPGREYLDHAGDRIEAAERREQRNEASVAYRLYRSAFTHRCHAYYGWMGTRGIEEVMEKAAPGERGD